MKNEEFDQIVSDTINQIQDSLDHKGEEYTRGDKTFHNFDKGARMTGKLREEVLDGFALKHYISVDDMVQDINLGRLPTIEVVNEKFGDIINYMILKKASIIDRINNNH